jgi:hypothetical protein
MNQIDINFQSFINDLPLILSDTMLELGLDAKALIQQRVQEKGLNASGGKTPDYSEAYAMYRKKKGRQTNYMDATLTGDMWQSTGIVNKEQTPAQTKVTVAGRDGFSQLKIDNISEKHFEILALSKEEEDTLTEIFNEKFSAASLEILERGL